MKVRALSATSIRDFLQCQLKLVFRFDRSIKSIKNDHARLGIAVHEALDQFTKRMSSKRSFPEPSDYDFAVSVFMNKAAEEGLESIDFYKQGREIVTDYVNRYDPTEEVLEVEYKFRLETPEGVPIAGAIDKVVKIDENTIAIVDYKTSRNALTPIEVDEDIQMSMYDLAASLEWPQYTNRILCLDYVRINKKVSTHRTDKDRDFFREFLQSIWIQINKLPDMEVKGKINKLCGWCDYRDHCPEYSELVNSSSMVLKPLTDMTDDEFIEHWENVSALKSIIESRQRELKMSVHEKFMSGLDVKGAGKELYSTQQSRTSYDTEKVVELVPNADWLSVLSVNKSRLDSYAKEDPLLRMKLNQIAQVSYNSPVYRTRAVKEADDYDFGQNEEPA